jgi:hypothetical protein
LRRLRDRVATLAAMPHIAPFLAGFREPWLFEDAQGAAATLGRAGFVDIETSLEPAPTILADAAQYTEYVRNIILQRHLEKLPTEAQRTQFMARLTAQAAEDDPPFSLDYWRLNLRGRK